MLEKRKPIAVGEAVQRVMEFAFQEKIEVVSLQQAHGRFLAEDVAADQDVPAFDRSPYDGYAIRSVDSQEACSDNPVTFKVVGEIGAGYESKKLGNLTVYLVDMSANKEHRRYYLLFVAKIHLPPVAKEQPLDSLHFYSLQ